MSLHLVLLLLPLHVLEDIPLQGSRFQVPPPLLNNASKASLLACWVPS